MKYSGLAPLSVLELGTRYVNEKSSVKYRQESSRWHDVFICRQVRGAGQRSYSFISSETAETEWEEAGGSQLIMSHSSYFSLRPSPFLSSFFFSPLCFSQCLTPTRKCAVSSCTSSTLSSLHVNKHPKCIIGSVLHVHAVQRAADGLVTAAKAHQSDTDVPVPPSTPVNYNPHPAPTGGDVAPMDSYQPPHPTPPAAHALLGAV